MKVNNESMKSNSDIRCTSRNQLKGNWGIAVLLCLIFSIICGFPGYIPYFGLILGIVLSGPLTLGLANCFLKLVRHESFMLENLFDGFKNFSSAIISQLLISVFVFLWSLLFIIPGIVAYYSYSMVFYILSDNPKMNSLEALNYSKNIMSGYKWKLFCLHLSFIGWIILSVFTLGIAMLWITPYIYTSNANFYEDLKIAILNK